MKFPSFNGTYSNICKVSQVQFLNDVQQFTKMYKDPSKKELCNYCCEPGTPLEPLQRCGGCKLVSYCNRECQKNDRRWHKYVCKEFPFVNGKNAFFTTGPMKEHLEILNERAARLPMSEISASEIFFNPRYCNTCKESCQDHLTDCLCTCFSYCNKRCAQTDNSHKKQCALFRDILLSSNTNALLFALKSIPDQYISDGHKHLENITSLTIHVVSSKPMFDSKPWEDFMHQLPNLTQLNIVFIMQGKTNQPYSKLNEKLALQRCKDCENDNRIITYTVQQMQYHIFFSSVEYSEPDIVVIYNTQYEMSTFKEKAIHSKLSYCNMLHSQGTILVLMDTTQKIVNQAVKKVNSQRPIVQLVSPSLNQAIETLLNDTGIDNEAMNSTHYFACLKKK